jgi:hypothetical protein
MPESAAELEQLKADGELSLLLGRRVRRWFLHDDQCVQLHCFSMSLSKSDSKAALQ